MLNRRAEAGTGTLILFIAMIIVASITASVFIQTAGSLQGKALSVAQESQNTISTRVRFVGIYAVDSEFGYVKNFRVRMSLVAGSEAIKFSDSVLAIELKNSTSSLIYANKSCTNVSDLNGNGYFTDPIGSSGTYTVEYLIEGTNYQNGYLQRGDVVNICFSSSRNIVEDEEVSVVFLPSKAGPTSVDFYIPYILEENIKLYP